MAGNVEVGINTVREGDVLVVLESMKMEIPLVATRRVVSRARAAGFIGARGSACGGPRKQHEAPFDLRLDVLARRHTVPVSFRPRARLSFALREARWR